ncbi:MAG: DUF4004 family protein [Romboutsia sp.]
MDELISKKDLLIETQISYGQLYRWKRMNIIPEDWFIKKSTFTGQETFFPRGKILERINLIISMKDDVSLEDIANMFAKKEIKREFSMDFIIDKNAISNYTKEVFYNIYKSSKEIGKKELLILSIIENFVLKSIITLDELKIIIELIEGNFKEVFNDNGRIYLFRKYGVPFVLGCKDYDQLIVDKDALKIIEIDLIREISKISKNLI